MERGIITASTYATQVHDLPAVAADLERAALPSEKESVPLELFRALLDPHRDVLIGGLRRAVAKFLDKAPVATAAG